MNRTRYKGIEVEVMDTALDTVLSSDRWSTAEKTKFLKDWEATRQGRPAGDNDLYDAIKAKP